MVPCVRCSLTILRVSSSSGWDSRISLAGMDAGAPGFSSIAWSHILAGGNSWEASSLKTLENWEYCSGTPGTVIVGSGSKMTRAMSIRSSWWLRGVLVVLGVNCALAASTLLMITGSCEWLIHPLFQSILGWTAANQGYPRMTLLSPKSDKKNCRFVH
jgi:hypothetical protein